MNLDKEQLKRSFRQGINTVIAANGDYTEYKIQRRSFKQRIKKFLCIF